MSTPGFVDFRHGERLALQPPRIKRRRRLTERGPDAAATAKSANDVRVETGRLSQPRLMLVFMRHNSTAPVLTSIPHIHVGRPARLGPVTYFPLWIDAPVTDEVATGAAALIDVAEMPHHPEVEHLAVTNLSGTPVLLIEGELLEGGLQHRVLQHDVIVGSRQSLTVDVACVEAGRWHGAGGHRRQDRRASPRVRAALHSTGSVPERQQQVWQRVSTYAGVFGASPTSSYLDHVDHLGDQVEGVGQALEVVRDLQPLAGQRGVAFGIDGYPVGLEMFESTAALQSHLGQILSSLLLDATAVKSGTEVVPSERVRRLVAHLDETSPERDPNLNGGAGTLYRADTAKALVRGIGIDDRWVHLSAYNRRHSLMAVG